MARQAITYIILIISTLSIISEINAQTLKPITSAVTFKIKHSLGATAEGAFKGFSGVINFDPMNLGNASMRATIDVRTISTNIKLRDYTIRGGDYFDADKYPRISMVSTKIEKTTKENEYIGHFNLTIKNVTKNIKFPFIFTKSNSQGTFNGNFSIKRTEYGIGEKSFLLGDTVTIYIIVNTQE